jgi:chemotaxis protein CheX
MTLTNDNVQTLTRQAWQNMLGEDVESDVFAPADTAATLTSCVHITGEWDGAVTIGCSRELARTITEVMFGMEPGEASTGDIEDAFGELANVIGGGLKSLLPGTSMLSLPTVADGVAMTFPGSEVVLVQGFRARNESVVVAVHQRTGSDDPTTPTGDRSQEGTPS